MTGTSNCQEILQRAAGQMRGAGGTFNEYIPKLHTEHKDCSCLIGMISGQ